MEYLDKIFYINLDKRLDRRQGIENELFNQMQFSREKVERFPAIQLGQIGCIQSHIGVFKLAKERHYRNILILEDDFQFLVSREIWDKEISAFFKKGIDFYVLMLAHLCYECQPFDEQLSIGINCQDGSGYIVNECAYDKLIFWLTVGSDYLSKTRNHWIYMNDQIWKKMQKENKWFILNEPLGKQNNSISDLANQVGEVYEDKI